MVNPCDELTSSNKDLVLHVFHQQNSPAVAKLEPEVIVDSDCSLRSSLPCPALQPIIQIYVAD